MMTYIILIAGKGTRLQPLTLHYPKTLYKLDADNTILQSMIRRIKKYDETAEIIVVLGYMATEIMQELKGENVTFVINPYYEVTNSIASLWFAREYLERDNVVLINGDIVVEDKLMQDIICTKTDVPYVLMDTSSNNKTEFTVKLKDDKVLVMSKQLSNPSGNYLSIIKLDAISARLMKQEVETLVNSGMYDQYFENTLVQMILAKDFELYYKDCQDYQWAEVNCVDDILKAKEIHLLDEKRID